MMDPITARYLTLYSQLQPNAFEEIVKSKPVLWTGSAAVAAGFSTFYLSFSNALVKDLQVTTIPKWSWVGIYTMIFGGALIAVHHIMGKASSKNL